MKGRIAVFLNGECILDDLLSFKYQQFSQKNSNIYFD